MSETLEQCENCYFFQPPTGGETKTWGRCFRYPQDVQKQYTDWCGEYMNTIYPTSSNGQSK